VQHKLSYPSDSVEMAKSLVSQNGLDRARQIAAEGTTSANVQGNFYQLSVWREVKGMLRDWAEETPPVQGALPDMIGTRTIKNPLTIPPIRRS
jgi:hypothetical protein